MLQRNRHQVQDIGLCLPERVVAHLCGDRLSFVSAYKESKQQLTAFRNPIRRRRRQLRAPNQNLEFRPSYPLVFFFRHSFT